ncbi:hypothetical protein [Streptomyces sp. NPDC001508]|uniref:hypothetical protein n=1 Tax=Streptomyces sp. NPDC001508 TaxID=3154656 RepID=UPI00332C5142
MGVEAGAQTARSRALAVLRVRGRALAVALLPAAAAVILLAGGTTGHLVGDGWDTARGIVTVVALLVLLAAAGVALVVARARPAVSPTIPISEESAPDLYRMVRDLADRLDVPAPSAIALTPDCDSWLEDRTHPAHGPPAARGRDELTDPGPRPHRRTPAAPVLVIGSPFLWWMRVGELRAVLAPVVAGTGPSAHPDIAAARRFVRGLDAAVAVTSAPGRGPLTRTVLAGAGWAARLMLRGCRGHAAEMERGVAAAAAERAQTVDYGLRIVAQEQVGLAYAGWDRLLTRVALPAWRMGRWPSRLDAGVVAALTELSRRDRLAEGFASRLGERPACDLLEEPGTVDEAASLLAARLFHGGPAEPGPDWSPVGWQEYPEEVVDRKWRTDAARLHRVLDAVGVGPVPDATARDPEGPTLARVLDHLSQPPTPTPTPTATARHDLTDHPGRTDLLDLGDHHSPTDLTDHPDRTDVPNLTDHPGPSDLADHPRRTDLPAHRGPTGLSDHPSRSDLPDLTNHPNPTDLDNLTNVPDVRDATAFTGHPGPGPGDAEKPEWPEWYDEAGADTGTPRGAALAARLSAELAREEASAAAPTGRTAPGQGPDTALWEDGALPLFPLQPPRSARELLADHVTAMVCCAAMDTAGATPGLDWLDGPSLIVNGERAADLGSRVLSLTEDGDPTPLRAWLVESGIRPEKPVRLV